jgi:hypothetical protein
MNRVYEAATETAKKIRKTLKAAFPGVKFSVTSSTFSMGSSVYVSWTDGPMSSQVNAILSRFESGSFDGMQDMYTTTGYEWEGQIVVGAKYVSGSRQLSEERREQILTKLNELFAPGRYGDYSPYQWERAEKELIEAGELQGHSSQLPETPAPADPEPVTEQPAAIEEPDEPRGDNVIAFPVRDPEVAARLKAEKLMNSLTAILQTIVGTEITAMQLLMNPLSIDEMFKAAAEKIYS